MTGEAITKALDLLNSAKVPMPDYMFYNGQWLKRVGKTYVNWEPNE